MTIVASGEISLGGNATTTRSVACELGRSGTAAICMDESAVRGLAARTTAASAICMDNFYGKTAPPTAFGQSFGGGYYAGTLTTPANYYIIVSPNATGCAGNCGWKNNWTTVTGNCTNSTCNSNNGYWNTFTYLNNTDHPAGNWAATRSIDGYTDWYLPSICELRTLYVNCASMPTGQGYKTFCSQGYWSSTEYNYGRALVQCFYRGYYTLDLKFRGLNVRAIRRIT